MTSSEDIATVRFALDYTAEHSGPLHSLPRIGCPACEATAALERLEQRVNQAEAGHASGVVEEMSEPKSSTTAVQPRAVVEEIRPWPRDRSKLPPGCTGFGDCDCDVCFGPSPEPLVVEAGEPKKDEAGDEPSSSVVEVSSGKRYTVAVDFDGVIHSYTTPWVDAETIPDPPVEGAVEWLISIAAKFDVVIFTTRGKTKEGQRAVRHYLHEHGVSWGMNARVTDEKIPALVYLDDRGYRFTGPGSYPTAQQIHRAIPWNKPGASTTPPEAAPDPGSDLISRLAEAESLIATLTEERDEALREMVAYQESSWRDLRRRLGSAEAQVAVYRTVVEAAHTLVHNEDGPTLDDIVALQEALLAAAVVVEQPGQSQADLGGRSAPVVGEGQP